MRQLVVVGPLITFFRSAALVTMAVVALAFFVVFALGIAPMPNALTSILGGVLFGLAALWGLVVWVPLTRRFERAADVEGSSAGSAFINVTLGDAAGSRVDTSPGWMLLGTQEITVHFDHAIPGWGSTEPDRVIALSELEDVRIRAGSILEYPKLELVLRDGTSLGFTLIPPNGSAIRGPRMAEIRAVETAIRDAMNRGLGRSPEASGSAV